MTKLENGLTVKRLDNGMIGALEHLGDTAWKIKYLDGTASYSSDSKIKEHFFIQSKEPETIEVQGYTVVDLPVNDEPTIEELFENYGDDGVEPEQEKSMTYDEYLNQSDDVVTKHLEKEAHKIASDLIDNQKHYTNNGIQPITIMKANMTKEKYRGFLEGNILKYPLRYEDKDGLKDLKKTLTYLTWLIEDIEERGL